MKAEQFYIPIANTAAIPDDLTVMHHKGELREITDNARLKDFVDMMTKQPGENVFSWFIVPMMLISQMWVWVDNARVACPKPDPRRRILNALYELHREQTAYERARCKNGGHARFLALADRLDEVANARLTAAWQRAEIAAKGDTADACILMAICLMAAYTSYAVDKADTAMRAATGYSNITVTTPTARRTAAQLERYAKLRGLQWKEADQWARQIQNALEDLLLRDDEA